MGDENPDIGIRFRRKQLKEASLQSTRKIFNFNVTVLTRANADAINLLNNEFINIGDDEPEFINYEECDSGENIQCGFSNQNYAHSEERNIAGVALKWASSVVGQSYLRSQPARTRGGEGHGQPSCPSASMCIRRRRRNGQLRCCALVIISRRFACPRRC